jgi:hypothetical protein
LQTGNRQSTNAVLYKWQKRFKTIKHEKEYNLDNIYSDGCRLSWAASFTDLLHRRYGKDEKGTV